MSLERLARVVILGAVALALSFLIYAIIDSPHRTGSPMAIIVYYALPSCVALLLLASLRLSPGATVKLATAFMSTSLTIYALEAFFAVFGSTANPVSLRALAKSVGSAFDPRTRLEVIQELERQRVAAVPMVHPSFTFLSGNRTLLIDDRPALPLAGISDSPTVYCNEGGQWIVYESDEHGFNNPKGFYDGRPVDIAAIGDSFVQGACVPADANFVARIRGAFPRTVNLGIGGQGPLMTLATLKEYARPLKPRFLLWCYYEENDLMDLNAEKQSPILMRYLEPEFSQHLMQLQPQLDHAIREVVDEGRRIREAEDPLGERWADRADMGSAAADTRPLLVRFFLAAHLRERVGLRVDRNAQDLALFRAVLTEAQRAVASWGGQLYVVYTPGWQRFASRRPPDFARDEVLRVLSDLQIPTVDGYRAFIDHGDPLGLFPFRAHAHYNEAGYRVLADAVLSRLRN